MKSKANLFGIRTIIDGNIPVFNKKLDPGVVAEANRDNTIFVSEDAPDELLKNNLTLEEEVSHLKQMKRGNQYTNDLIIENTPSEFNIFKRQGDNIVPITNKANFNGSEGDPGHRWEKEAKEEATKNINNVQDMVSKAKK